MGTLSIDDLGDLPIRKFSQGFERAISGSQLGNLSFTSLEVVRDVDVNSPKLNQIAVYAKRVSEATIVLAGGALTIKLEGALIDDIGVDATQGGLPLEHLSFGFRFIEWRWTDGGPTRRAEYDLFRHEGGGTPDLHPSFVFFGPGVPAEAGDGDTPFTKLAIGTKVPLGMPGGLPGQPVLRPLTLSAQLGSDTVPRINAGLGGATLSDVAARFTAIGSDGQPYDVLRYDIDQAVVTSVALTTTPTGAVEEEVGFAYRKIRWTSESPTGEADHAAEYEVPIPH